ncbi:MAG: rRNA ((2251)-2'-O)-methyltransferase RlmB [Bacteroidetes bacterium]|nr:rRNA ((2251)-2'-O)-methyltransferase RlmB [Bacteroidota bacterium]
MNRIIAGRQPVIEALRAGTQIEKVVFLMGVHGRAIDEIKSRQEFRELASDATTQGVVALMTSQQKYALLETILDIPHKRDEKGLILILDEIEDPQNLGALVRTAECAGVHGVIIPKHHSASVTSAVAKASAGAVEHMAMAEVTNIVSMIEELKQQGYWIVGLDAMGDKLYTEIDYKIPIAIVVGNEGKGIRRLVKEHCDFLVKIPLYGKIASLNASVAGALVMYEATKQRTSL